MTRTATGASTWVYDVENRLVSARGLYAANLRYDPLGRLHETVTGVEDTNTNNDITVRRLYDGGALVAEYDQTGTMLRRFVHGPNTGADTPLVWYEGPTMSQAAARMLSTDLQGSVTSVTDFGGNAIALGHLHESITCGEDSVPANDVTGRPFTPEAPPLRHSYRPTGAWVAGGGPVAQRTHQVAQFQSRAV